MKIQNVGTPLVLGYYLSKEKIDEIVEVLKGGYCSESNNMLTITVDFNNFIDETFRLYKSKTKKITVGNGYAYEYEIPEHERKDDKVFIFQTEDGKFYKCDLFTSEIQDQSIVISFNIIK